MALLDEGALGHQVLAPGGDAEAEGEQPDAEGDASHWVLAADPVGHAEADEPGEPDAAWHGRHHLGGFGVLGVGLADGGRRGRPAAAVALEAWVLVAHVRSPIQKQTSISPPDAEEQPDEPLAHRPDAAQADAAGVGGVLDRRSCT